MRTVGVAIVPGREAYVPILLPFYTAEAQNSLDRGSRPYSVVEILNGVFKEEFTKVIQGYLEGCPEGAAKAIGNDGAKEFKLMWLSEPKVESSLDQPACTTAVDLLFRAKVEALVPGEDRTALKGEHDGPETNIMIRKYFWANFRARYMLGLWDKRCSAPIVAPTECYPADVITEQKSMITNQYLLPILHAEDYPKIGWRVLNRYYPEALENPTAVDGWELAKRMKLNARKVRFPKGSDIQGRIYFDWTKVKIIDENGKTQDEDIPPMTILINQDLCFTPEIENSTLIHECCHVYLDLVFFKLQMLSGKPYTSYTSRKRKKKKYSHTNSPIEWMELQAEKLPAYIMLEEKNTRSEIERLLTLRGGVRSPETMYWIMTQLASIFKVSRSMAKYRMIELGYPEAEGIFSYVDGARIPDYGCGGVWEKGITYSIALGDIGALLREDRRFVEALASGRYVYVEGHFCIDAEPYIKLDYRRNRRLTEYARHNIEKCCIAFFVEGRYANASYEGAQAARKTPVKNKLLSRHGFAAEPKEKNKRLEENKSFIDDSHIWAKLKQNMPDTLIEAFAFIMKEKKVSQDELAARMGVSRTAYYKWLKGRPSKRHIVAICIALDVRGDIGMDLLRLSGQVFLNNREDDLLQGMIFDTNNLTVRRANEIMQQDNLPALTEGKNEELAC